MGGLGFWILVRFLPCLEVGGGGEFLGLRDVQDNIFSGLLQIVEFSITPFVSLDNSSAVK